MRKAHGRQAWAIRKISRLHRLSGMQEHHENAQNNIRGLKTSPVIIIGGGLAGCEAAWQLLQRGHAVHLVEMKPQKFSPAHKMEHLAELVCSNSLKSNNLDSAPGLLKQELRRLNSLILSVADQTAVAAGSALAVDRAEFAKNVEAKLKEQKNFTLIRTEVTQIPQDALTIVATGPLTSDPLAQSINQMLGGSYPVSYTHLTLPTNREV